MSNPAREVLQRLVDARAVIDAHDSEFSTPSWDDYEAALAELGALEPGERARLVEGLTDSSPAVRVEAARALKRLSLTEARPELERGLADAVPEVREACAEALIQVAPASVLPTLLERGADVTTDVLSRCADATVRALGAEALAGVVKSGLSPVRAEEAWARLYALDPQGTTQVLEQKLLTGDGEWVFGVSRLVCAQGGTWSRPAFSVLARLPERDRRSRGNKIASAEALATVGDENDIDAILALLSTGGPEWPRDVTLQTAFLAGRRTQTPAAERVIAAAGASASEQRQLMEELTRVAGCAWEAGARGAVQGAVRKALLHPDEATVTAAVRAASAWGLEALLEDVVATLQRSGSDGFEAQSAFFRQEGVMEALRRDLGHADVRRRREAARALGMTGEPRVRDWLKPLVHDSDPQVRSEAEGALQRKVHVPNVRAWLKPEARDEAPWAPAPPRAAERFFPSFEVSSPRGRFTLQAGTSKEDPQREALSGFRYRLLERGAEPRVIWERWQADDEGPPHGLAVSDEGWAVFRTRGLIHEVIAVSPAGKDALRALVHREGTDTRSGRAWRGGWAVTGVARLLGGDGLLDIWWRAWPSFVHGDGGDWFVWRTYWGQRLVLDLTHETLLPEDSPAWTALAPAMDEAEGRGAYLLLLNLALHPYGVLEFLALHGRSRTAHPLQDALWQKVPAALLLVGLHHVQEALPVLRLWEVLDAPLFAHAASHSSVAMGPGWALEKQLFRPLVHYALRLLGEEPQGYATYHFLKDERRFPVSQHVEGRRELASDLHPGMSPEQVLLMVGSPDHIRQWSRNVGVKALVALEVWEYDFRTADGWVTLRLIWEEGTPQGRLTAVQEEPASWLTSEQRVLELLLGR